MPSDPIELRILQNVQTTLQGIARASGYHHDVNARAVRLDPNASVEDLLRPLGLMPFILIEVKPETWSVAGTRPNRVDLSWPVTIHWADDCDQTDDNSRAEKFFKGCADIETALVADITRGGLATDTKVIARRAEPAAGARVWAQVDVLMLVKRIYGSPNG